jgi:hydrophobic/amphiphilic exporter-1 (mainly G- bacteria), HAE1 family
MFLANASVRRPVAMACLIIGLSLLGMNAYRNMGLELMPKIDLPFITVSTIFPGASPEEIEGEVAKKIEDAVGTIDGLKHVTSSCMENICLTSLEFELGVDVDIAATDVREKLGLILADLPDGAEDPTILKFDVNATPIVKLALTGDVPLDELYDFADNKLRDRLTVIRGVADVALTGGAEREVQVILDQDRLAARGLTSLGVVGAIRGAVLTIPSGRVRERGTEYSVKFDAEYDEVEALADLPIAEDEFGRVLLNDVGEVRMGTEEVREAAWVDGRPAVAIKVVKKADANAVRVAEAVKSAIARLNEELPGGMELVWVTDDGGFIRATNVSAWLNVAEGILLTAAILFFFLFNVRALLVVAITMPLTIIIGLFFMGAVGFTLNTSTLIAVGLSVGILVTNSIVVLESIVTRLEKTGDPKEASRIGTAEAFVAVFASAGTNIVVLFPLSTMGSMVGLFLRPLALTMFLMTAVSLFISFTLTPLLCSVLLRPVEKREGSLLFRLRRVFDGGLEGVIRAYQGFLGFVERRRWAGALILLVVALLFVHAVRVAGTLGSSMIADSDKGELVVKLEYPIHYDLQRTTERVRQVEKRLQGLPELRHVLSTVGRQEGVVGKSSRGVHLAEVFLRFSARDERETTIDELLEITRARLVNLPGAIVTVSQTALIGGQEADVQLEISGDRFAELTRLAAHGAELAAAIPGVADIDTSVREGKPEIRVRPNREMLIDLGAAASDLGLNLRANLEGIAAGTYKRGARSYDIVVKLEERAGKDQVRSFLLPGEPGRPITLETLAGIVEGTAPAQITRQDKQRISLLYANLAPDLPLGTAVARIRDGFAEGGSLPPGYGLRAAGMFERMENGQRALGEAGLISIVLVILSLAAILESFKQPFLILVTVPLALIGMFWGLGLARLSLGTFEIMAAVMMTGIVVNNAILIVDRMNVLVAKGMPRHQAVIQAAGDRFRPVVMITLAAVLGMIPLAFGAGQGAELRNGVGIASMGGILVSGVLTLFVIPVLYTVFTRRA